MTAKEKAIELIDKFYSISSFFSDLEDAKECALYVVDEILNHHYQEQGLYRIDTYFWKQVKKEIENL